VIGPYSGWSESTAAARAELKGWNYVGAPTSVRNHAVSRLMERRGVD
jgi:hypothetical protein